MIRHAYRTWVGIPDGTRRLAGPRPVWQDIIKMNPKVTGYGSVDCLSEQRPVAGLCEHRNEPSDCIMDGEFRGCLDNYWLPF